MKVLQHRYTPRGSCVELFHSRHDEVLLSGPAGTGKSRACLEKLHAMCLLNPGMRALIVRKTASSLTSTALVTYREHVAKESLEANVVYYYGGSSEEPPQYRYTNGSTIAIGGMDKATRVMSSEYDLIYVQEAIELTATDWEALTSRLRNGKVSFQQLIADTNPDTPTHWLKQRCDAGQTKMIDAKHEDNPVLFNADGTLTSIGKAYIGKLDNLTGVRKSRLRSGLWVSAEGIIYEDWDTSIHVVDPFTIPLDWTRWWTVDFGYKHPFVLQCWAEDPDGRLYLYREIFHSGRLVEDHAKQIMSIVKDADGKWLEPEPTAVICDHDAEGRATLEKYLERGTVPAKKSVLDGIQAVQQRIKVQGDGKPRIFIFKDAVVERDKELLESLRPTSTLEEIPGYVWDTSGGKKIKESPLKENDDGCDAMRYVVTYRDRGAMPRVRMM